MLTMLQGLKFVALAGSGTFAGTSLYINLVEHPSRRNLPVESLLQQWLNSFELASRLAAGSSMLTLASSSAVYFLSTEVDWYRYLWLAPAAQSVLGLVYSLGVIVPEVKKMQAPGIIEKKGETAVRAEIDRWNRRHAVRTFINVSAYFCLLLAVV